MNINRMVNRQTFEYMDILNLIGRKKDLFSQEVHHHEKRLSDAACSSKFLVIGGAGSSKA